LSSEKREPFRQLLKKSEEGRKVVIPTLKYRKGKNFYKFKAALSEAALKEYGNLGKPIELEKYYVPTLVLPDHTALGIYQANVAFMTNKGMKELAKEVGKMNRDRPKLYGLIRQHMSIESRDKVYQQPDYATWHRDKDPEKLWQAIAMTHKVDCVSNMTEVMILMARRVSEHKTRGIQRLYREVP
jgi:hypothetical protein